ncbi:hypothetical protein KUCAC02_015031 [Chaenocephalus aceratus]|uniref:Uncharacterized protein n=1 Tax=Chaenocephalus aceratus TaxID=36190 RepID=A0ACB9XXG5_CHAAC|nr:hypothetical protein KUCAC02_015031 [Chaenocephalus aceratus]
MGIPLAPRQIQAIVKARQIPESRRGSSVCTSSLQEAVQSPRGAPQNSPPLQSNISQPITSSLKIKNSGVLSAPLDSSSGSPRPHRLTSNKVLETLSVLWQGVRPTRRDTVEIKV